MWITAQGSPTRGQEAVTEVSHVSSVERGPTQGGYQLRTQPGWREWCLRNLLDGEERDLGPRWELSAGHRLGTSPAYAKVTFINVPARSPIIGPP